MTIHKCLRRMTGRRFNEAVEKDSSFASCRQPVSRLESEALHTAGAMPVCCCVLVFKYWNWLFQPVLSLHTRLRPEFFALYRAASARFSTIPSLSSAALKLATPTETLKWM